jgi:hypothetical protein
VLDRCYRQEYPWLNSKEMAIRFRPKLWAFNIIQFLLGWKLRYFQLTGSIPSLANLESTCCWSERAFLGTYLLNWSLYCAWIYFLDNFLDDCKHPTTHTYGRWTVFTEEKMCSRSSYKRERKNRQKIRSERKSSRQRWRLALRKYRKKGKRK